ncbi:unnamed protein product, partial [marine sediment metagenome]
MKFEVEQLDIKGYSGKLLKNKLFRQSDETRKI